MSELISKVINLLTRKKINVIFNDLHSVEPVSSMMGCDRGKAIDRYYIENFLADYSDLIHGSVLEIAGDTYCRNFGKMNVDRCDILHATPDNPNATIVGDLTRNDTLPADAYDCFICTQTFNFIFDVQQAVTGACRVLKPGGVILATMSGLSQISRYDMDRWGDYWRFTEKSVRSLFEPVFSRILDIRTYGNVLAASALLQGLCVEDLPDYTQLDVVDQDYQVLVAVAAQK